MADQLDVLAIGNAIVDVIATRDDDFLRAHDIAKGGMQLIDAEAAVHLHAQLDDVREISGGSAANTAVGIAVLGGRAGFVGRVADDALGAAFADNIREAGVAFTVAPATDGQPTARSIIIVTPDAERSMSTCLGAAQEIDEKDIDAEQVASARITYIEGYLWDQPAPIRAVRRAIAAAHAAGRQTALTLSDQFCVDRHRGDFVELLRAGHIDLVFANEAETLSMFETDNLDRAISSLAEIAPLAVVTRSEKGAIVVNGAERVTVPAAPIRQLVDSTGAGDLFAAGFLAGFTQGRPLGECATMGTIAAAEIIEHYGARPEADLRARMNAALGAHG